MMKTYLLDTNIASHIIKGDLPIVRERLVQVPMHSIFISVVTEAELLYGVAKRDYPKGLTKRVTEFLARVEVLPWTSDAAKAYGQLRAACDADATTLASMEMMIAAHASAEQRKAKIRHGNVLLVTRDQVFSRVPERAGLMIEDWTVPK